MIGQAGEGGVFVGVDVGGTFTDVVVESESDGSLTLFKLATTPQDPADAIVAGIGAALSMAGVGAESVTFLGHGTTVATNAVVENRWARTGLLTTRGFRDIVEIRRQQRPDVYDLRVPKPAQIASRDLRLEVTERMLADGTERTPLDENEIRALVGELVRARVEAIAICFLHSFSNPTHERRVAELASRDAPGVFISASVDVSPEFREYPRVSTTLVNAAVGPVMSRYLASLSRQVEAAGIGVEPQVMLANGGVAPPRTAATVPVRTIGSGPAAGVIGAASVARASGYEDVVTFDVGGTSTDVCLVVRGTPRTTTERRVNGHPVRGSAIDVHSVGAGGGSVASVDVGGRIVVGPESAGAVPGPACYQRGGIRPTVTDANLLLGRLNPHHLLSGRMTLSLDAAAAAVQRFVADPLRISVIDAASAILRTANAKMAQAIRLISIEAGYDPRSFALIAYGGAGPMHAEVAEELGFPTVVVPRYPGVFSALGLLVSDLRSDFARTRVLSASRTTIAEIDEIFETLDQEAVSWLKQEAPGRDCRLERSIDMRYLGQSFELNVPLPDRVTAIGDAVELFQKEHARAYSYSSAAPVEFVTFRVAAISPTHRVGVRPAGSSGAMVPSAGTRSVYFESAGFVPTQVYLRDELRPSACIRGPAVIEQEDSTVVLPPGCQARVDPHDTLVVQFSAATTALRNKSE